MEKRDLYDENRNKLNEVITATDNIEKGKYILVVVIFIQNAKGEFLIQRTSLAKEDIFASTGGHPIAGEDSLTGLKREVKEEIDIDLNDYEDPILFKTIKDDDCFLDLYYLKVNDIDISKLNVQKEEVAYLKWFSIDEIKELIASGDFRKSHANMFKECLKYLNK